MDNIKDLDKKTILVLGAGKTCLASAFFILDKANKVLLSESKGQFEINSNSLDKVKKLIKEGVETEFNKNSDDFINRADLVITSPGISFQSDIIKKIISLKTPIISDIELASYFIKKPLIAVTGTNGKTTTTSLITHMLNISGKKAISCGNIGNPLIEVLNNEDTMGNNIDYYVLEISSFQIFYSPTLSCEIALCLNITPDHLDWHGNSNHYIETKKRLFLQQKKNSWAILNINDNVIKNFNLGNNVFYFSSCLPQNINIQELKHIAFCENDVLKIKENNKIEDVINKNKLNIFGNHNIENALASIATLKIIQISNEKINESLSSFEGVEHRLEFVKKSNGKIFYNDSKATNPEATIKAIEAFEGKQITLILGGRDKKTELRAMIESIKKHVHEVILFGEAKDRFQKELDNNNYKELKIVKNLDEAVRTSLKSRTDIVLFSPACSSFDMFKNYEERGNVFKELISKY